MTVTYLGGLTVGESMPGALALGASGAAGIGLALPDITARLDALLAFSPLSVDFTAQLALASQMVASVQAGIALGLAPPSIAAQIAIIGAIVADLTTAIVSINAELTTITDLQAVMGVAGVHAYHYQGRADTLGAEMTTELSGGLPAGAPGDAMDAVIIATTTPATWTAITQMLKVTP